MSLESTIYKTLEDCGGDSQMAAELITKSLNKAVADYTEKSKDAEKKKDAEALATHFNAFTKVHYPELSSTITAQEIIDMYDVSRTIFNEVSDWDKLLNKIAPKEEKKNKSLADMVAEMGW